MNTAAGALTHSVLCTHHRGQKNTYHSKIVTEEYDAVECVFAAPHEHKIGASDPRVTFS